MDRRLSIAGLQDSEPNKQRNRNPSHGATHAAKSDSLGLMGVRLLR